MWEITRDTGVLDENSTYAYTLWAKEFAGTSVVAEVLGARLPGHPLTGLAWVPGELWVFVLALAVATLAVVMPAWRAYRVDVAGVLSRA